MLSRCCIYNNCRTFDETNHLIMALVKFSALVSEMRNKLNGSVFSKNRAGNYLRNKVTPVNPQTTKQVNVRGSFGLLSSNWRDLTQEQRNGWNDASANFPYNNIFGDQKILSGLQLYVKLNQNLSTGGLPPITDAPLPQGFPAITGFAVLAEIVDDAFELTSVSTITGDLVGFTALFFATPGVSAGKAYVKNQFRKIANLTAATGPVDLSAAYLMNYDTPAVGSKVFVRMALLNNATGQVSTGVQDFSIVVVAE